MKARHKDTGEIVELAEEGIISSDGRRFCWYQVELIPEPIDGEQPEVDLEKEMEEYFGENWKDDTPIEVQDDMMRFARHFYELGLNARKENK